MVICVVVSCSKRSDRDKDVSFHRIPTVRRYYGKRELELSIKRRDGYLAAISRENIHINALESIEYVQDISLKSQPIFGTKIMLTGYPHVI